MNRVIDTETTGLNGSIVEVASVPVDEFGNTTGNAVSHIVDPCCPIEIPAMAVHNITEGMVHGQPKIHEIIDQHKIEDGYLIAHNAGFDVGKLPGDFVGKDVKVLCTLKLARALYPKEQFGGHKNMVLFYGLGCYKDFQFDGEAHRADYDACVTASILAKMLKDHDMTLDDAYRLTNPLPKDKLCYFKKYRDQKVTWEYVADNDKSYCKWLLNKIDWGSDDQDVKDYLEGRV